MGRHIISVDHPTFPHKFQRWTTVARGHRASRSHNKVIVWSTTLSISLDGDQSKQEDSVKRRIIQSDRHKFWHKFCINEGGGGIINGTLFFLRKIIWVYFL